MAKKLGICDVLLVLRHVELPDACEKCGLSFVEGNNVVAWSLKDEFYQGNKDNELGFKGTPVSGMNASHLPRGYGCKCGHVAVYGNGGTIDSEELGKVEIFNELMEVSTPAEVIQAEQTTLNGLVVLLELLERVKVAKADKQKPGGDAN